ncbi:MAG: primosomal protein N' [Sedimentisphaerales bacterium]|nr:primosomal protein N' [Sedimentisphaerales bacterium]
MSYKPKTENGLFGPMEALDNRNGQSVDAADAKIVRVARIDGGDGLYDYAIPEDMVDFVYAGQRVNVPFGRGNRSQIAFCIDFPESSNYPRLKYIGGIVDEQPLVTEELLSLARWISQYYCYPLGMVLSAIVPAAVKKQAGSVLVQYLRPTAKLLPWLNNEIMELKEESSDKKLKISAKGQRALEIIRELHNRRTTADNNNSEYLYKLLTVCNIANCSKPVLRTLAKVGLLEFISKREMPSDELLALLEQEEQEQEPSPFNPQNSEYDSSPIFDFNSDDELPAESIPSFQLNADQLKASETINDLIAKGGFNAVLLHGVTGSGKTEVYMECIEQVVARGQQAIVMVPEIALTPQTERRFIERFGSVSVLHSGMSQVRRNQQWRQIAEGRANVIVGARSAVFAPVPSLGLIVVDEEHEGSYKQDQSPRYHGRDVAIKRAHNANISIILGSATPSLETLTNCQKRPEFKYVTLPRRVKDLPLPKITVVNLKEEYKKGRKDNLLSELLEKELKSCIKSGRQAILFLNRRGHSNVLFCPSCQYVVNCPNCDVSLKVHRRRSAESVTGKMLMCHHCLHSCKVPDCCPVCRKQLVMLSPGTQQAEDQLIAMLKDMRIQRVDSDSMKPDDYRKVLNQFGRGEIDVLIGTQMIAKGLDFPNVALVGILNADTALAIPDYRSSERTFQLISQVAGRCGRADASGRVVLQTFMPDEPAIEFACKHDYNGFARLEMQLRKQLQMPPYWRMARIIMSDPLLETLEEEAKKMRLILDNINEQLEGKLDLRGPMPAAIARLEKYHRAEIIIKCATPGPIQQMLGALRTGAIEGAACRVVIDVDPVNMS